MRLESKVALVTGGGSGIGRGVCLEFARQGAFVAIPDINGKGAEAVAAEIAATGGAALAIQVDITKWPEIQRMTDAAMRRFGRIDILVNNAGTRLTKSFLDHSEDEWRGMIDLNLTAHFLCCRAIVPHMIKAGKGRIINMASIAGLVGRPNRIAYCAAKGGLLAMTRALAADLAGTHITANAIVPGLIDSPLHAAHGEDPNTGPSALWVKEIPTGRWGQPQDIAHAAVFLASDESDFFSGIELRVDGGWLGARIRAGETDA